MTRDRRGHPGCPLRHRLAQIDQHALGDGERHVDRRHLVDDGERREIGRPHEIADLDVSGTDPARERCADRGVAFLDLQIVERRLVGLDGSGQDVSRRLGVVEIDLRGGALADQFAVAPDIAQRAFELGLVLRQHPLGLLDLGVDLARIEREQQVAFVDLGAVLEMDRHDGGFQPRLQRHAGDRRDGSVGVDIDGHGLALRLRQFDRDHPRALRPLCAGVAPHPRRAGCVGRDGDDADNAGKKYPVTLFHNFSRPPVRKGRDSCSRPP